LTSICLDGDRAEANNAGVERAKRGGQAVLNCPGLTSTGFRRSSGRGFDGWSSIQKAAARCIKAEKPTTILYFGDFDPSGEHMTTSLRKRLHNFSGGEPKIERIAILKTDIEQYNLPPDFAKLTDSRSKSFIERYGDEAV